MWKCQPRECISCKAMPGKLRMIGYCMHNILSFAAAAGTGKTLLARAVANRTDACFIRVIGSELVQKYVGEGARMVRELFQVHSIITATAALERRLACCEGPPAVSACQCLMKQ